MTKEEIEKIEAKFQILEKYHCSKLNGELTTTGDRVAAHAAFGAMDEFAKQRCVSFAEWVQSDDFLFVYKNGKWTPYPYTEDTPIYTTEELYNLFTKRIIEPATQR
jgi:hypothetical protein